MLRVSGIIHDSIVDGPGMREVVFFQGCSHRCQGCHNPQTWDESGGEPMTVAEILEAAKPNPLTAGITLSGGEPFDQPLDELAELIKRSSSIYRTVWIYTGYTYEQLIARGLEHEISPAEFIVDGRFIESERSLSLAYRGSKNQRFIDVKQSIIRGEAVEVLLGKIFASRVIE